MNHENRVESGWKVVEVVNNYGPSGQCYVVYRKYDGGLVRVKYDDIKSAKRYGDRQNNKYGKYGR